MYKQTRKQPKNNTQIVYQQKKTIQKELFVFLQAIEDSSGLKILVQYELEEAQRNQNKKKSTYKETSDIYSEW